VPQEFAELVVKARVSGYAGGNSGRGDSRIIRFLTYLAREFDALDHSLSLEPVGDVAGLAVQLPLDHLRRGCRERCGVSIRHQRQDCSAAAAQDQKSHSVKCSTRDEGQLFAQALSHLLSHSLCGLAPRHVLPARREYG
jgi:hypothetical protein